MSTLSEEFHEMMAVFNQTVNDIDIRLLQTSLKYTKDREFSLGANVVRLQSYAKMDRTLPDFVLEKLEEPEYVDFGLTEMCLPQTDTYESMPEHKWRKIREALNDVSSEQDIEHLINYCNERFLFFGWKQMRESMEILGRPQFRKLLWKLEGPKVSEAENYEAILEVLDKTERNELKAIHWTKAI
ncbi:Conserved_hypothetical protein [Hexamita inflata]|uniref:Uncharacterized protein n=1 Tax=Hexamita inflata TaxID=28002 RepID=A0ABP1H9C8_9EUKA